MCGILLLLKELPDFILDALWEALVIKSPSQGRFFTLDRITDLITQVDWWSLERKIRARGPDFTSLDKSELSYGMNSLEDIPELLSSSQGLEIDEIAMSSVLYLRGESVSEQPLTDEDGRLLLYNGEIFSSEHVFQDSDPDRVNDGVMLFQALVKVSQQFTEDMDYNAYTNSIERILMKDIEGDYSMVFYDVPNG